MTTMDVQHFYVMTPFQAQPVKTMDNPFVDTADWTLKQNRIEVKWYGRDWTEEMLQMNEIKLIE